MSSTDSLIERLVDRRVLDSSAAFAAAFQQGRPFRHVVIDDFLAPDICADICHQFPAFHEVHAINEDEQVGGKATREKVRTLGSAFRTMDDLVRSPEFLRLIGAITGIEDLQYDPFYFGGGTHENRDGQDLDPHIDFNYHPLTGQHRRLNLIIYLNEGWEESWGGSLQLHRDPHREPGEDEITAVAPLMNRCVIFETTEHSWHGFERINLPADRKELSRKSFAVYYYTDDRPAEETGDEHSTVYVERHLPGRFEDGLQLTADDVREIKDLLKRRDQHLKRLYREIQQLHGRMNASRYSGQSGSRLAELPTDLDSAVRMVLGLRHRVDEMEASTSWRITAPVRAFKRLISGRRKHGHSG